MRNIFSDITWRTMKQNRSRTIVTIIGVILSTAMISAVTSFGGSVRSFLIHETIHQTGNWHLEVSVPTEESEEIKKDERVEAVGTTASLGFAKAEGLDDKERPYYQILSYSKECMDMINMGISEGRAPENDSEILVSSVVQAMQEEGRQIAVGDTLTLSVGKRMQGNQKLSDNNIYMSLDNPEVTEEMLAAAGGEETLEEQKTRSFQVVGIYNNSAIESYISGASYQLICGPTKQETDSSGMVLRMKSVHDVNDFEIELLEKFSVEEYSRNSTLLRWYGVDRNDNFLEVIAGLLGIVICLIVAASVSLIYNAFSISMRERTGQFGLLSSVGATKRQLKKTLRFEAWTVCAIGIPLGLLSGVTGIGITLHFLGPLIAKWTYGIEGDVPLKISVMSLVLAAVIAFVTVQISAWIPARRLKKLSPLEAIRASQDIRKDFGKVKKNGITGKIFGLEGMLASKNYRRDKRKYRTTVVSLTLSIVLFVTAGSFVMYLGEAGEDIFSESEVDISVEGMIENTDKNSGNNSDGTAYAVPLREELEQMEGIDEIYTYRKGYYVMRVAPEQIPEGLEYLYSEADDGTLFKSCYLYILPDEEFAEYARDNGMNPEDYLNQKELKAIYKDSHRQYDGRTGTYSTVSMLQKEEGETFEVADCKALTKESFGVMENIFSVTARECVKFYPKSSIESYYSFMISFFVPESTFENAADGAYKQQVTTYFSIMSKEYKQVYQELLKKSKDTDSALYGLRIINMNEGKEKRENIQTVIQVLTTGFVVLMSLIAVANIFNTVSTNLYLRKREFAMLRSVGMTEKGFRKMMGCECLIYGLRSILYGVILSAGSSYLVYRVVQNGVGFSWQLPWMYWLISIAAVLLVVGITMIYTMRKMRRDNVIDVLKQNG